MERDINKLFEKEEEYWHQSARTNWIKAGDKNTRFFHAYANVHRRRNLINRVLNNIRGWETNLKEITRTSIIHFQKLFFSGGTRLHEDVLFGLQGKVTKEMNLDL